MFILSEERGREGEKERGREGERERGRQGEGEREGGRAGEREKERRRERESLVGDGAVVGGHAADDGDVDPLPQQRTLRAGAHLPPCRP